MRYVWLAFAAWLLAGVAAAQEITGTVTATIDGEERTWFGTAEDGMSQSDWSGDERYASVSIFAHPGPDTTLQARDALMIGFEMMASADAREVSLPEIVWMIGGMSDAYVADEDTGATIDLDSVTVEDDTLRISGSFAGEMVRSTDKGDTRAIEGRFEAVLQKL